MKKLSAIIFIFISTFCYARHDADLDKQIRKLDFNISSLIVDCEKELKVLRYKTIGLAWTATYRLLYESPARFNIRLEKGSEYVFYTMTTGPAVRVCLERKNGFYRCRVSSKSKIIYRFNAEWDEEVFYRIQPMTAGTGLHVSYLTKITKEEE